MQIYVECNTHRALVVDCRLAITALGGGGVTIGTFSSHTLSFKSENPRGRSLSTHKLLLRSLFGITESMERPTTLPVGPGYWGEMGGCRVGCLPEEPPGLDGGSGHCCCWERFSDRNLLMSFMSRHNIVPR